MSSPLLPSAHLSFANVLFLRIKPQPNCIKYPGRQIAFNLLEPEIAQIRLLRRHRNTPHGRTFVCVYKTTAKLLFIFERHTLISWLNSKWPNLVLYDGLEKYKHRQQIVLSLKLRLESMFISELLIQTFPHDNLLLPYLGNPSSWGHAGIVHFSKPMQPAQP